MSTATSNIIQYELKATGLGDEDDETFSFLYCHNTGMSFDQSGKPIDLGAKILEFKSNEFNFELDIYKNGVWQNSILFHKIKTANDAERYFKMLA